MTSLETLLCNECGAPLEIPSTANFATCVHCKATLVVKREHGALTSEVAAAIERATRDEVAEATQELREDVARLERLARVTRIDTDWEKERVAYISRTKSGTEQIPKRVHATVALGVSVVFAGFLAVAAKGMPGYFPFFVLVGGGVSALVLVRAADRYDKAYKAYLERREAATRGGDPVRKKRKRRSSGEA